MAVPAGLVLASGWLGGPRRLAAFEISARAHLADMGQAHQTFGEHRHPSLLYPRLAVRKWEPSQAMRILGHVLRGALQQVPEQRSGGRLHPACQLPVMPTVRSGGLAPSAAGRRFC
jgi:hypothetical protein